MTPPAPGISRNWAVFQAGTVPNVIADASCKPPAGATVSAVQSSMGGYTEMRVWRVTLPDRQNRRSPPLMRIALRQIGGGEAGGVGCVNFLDELPPRLRKSVLVRGTTAFNDFVYAALR
jgi:hypothetical protein